MSLMTSLNIISNGLTHKIVYAWFSKPTAPAITTHTYSSLTIPTCNTRGGYTNKDLPKRKTNKQKKKLHQRYQKIRAGNLIELSQSWEEDLNRMTEGYWMGSGRGGCWGGWTAWYSTSPLKMQWEQYDHLYIQPATAHFKIIKLSTRALCILNRWIISPAPDFKSQPT